MSLKKSTKALIGSRIKVKGLRFGSKAYLQYRKSYKKVAVKARKWLANEYRSDRKTMGNKAARQQLLKQRGYRG